MITFTNQASLSYNNIITNSNIATGQIIEVLSVTKTVLRDEYGPSDTLTYVVSVINSGTVPYTDLTLTDSLGEYTLTSGGTPLYPLNYIDGSVKYFVNGALQTPPAVIPGPPLAISGITVPAGGNALIIYETGTTQYAPLSDGSTIVNEATVSGVGVTPISATETANAVNAPSLTISKSVSPTVVAENDRITYTFVILNYGNTAAVATDNASVSDVFDPILTNLTVDFNGNVWSEGTNYTYDQTSGAFVTVPGQITVPAATYTQDPVTGVVSTDPGVAILTVSGNI